MDLTTVLDKLLLPLALLAGQLWLNAKFKSAEDKRATDRAKTEAKREAEAKWRDEIIRRLEAIEDKQNRSIAQQAVDIRSDIIHKCHRYLDDLGKASIEEKNALHDEHESYTQFCADLDIDNNFIDELVQQVMDLPMR